MEKTYELGEGVKVYLNVSDNVDECYLTIVGEGKMRTFNFSDDCYAIDLDSLELVFKAYGNEVGES